MYQDTKQGRCPFNGERFAERTSGVQVLPGFAVKSLSELVEGAVYRLHFCTDYGRIALPAEKETWYHVVRPWMTFRGLNDTGEAMFDVRGAHESWAHHPWELGLEAGEDGTWEHHRYLMLA